MSMPEPREKPSTADLVSAGEAPAPVEKPAEPMGTERIDRSDEDLPGNVRRMDPAARRDPERRADEIREGERPTALLPSQECTDLRHRWEAIQTGFVDEPRHAVEEADSLVAQTMKRVAEVFSHERTGLERQWSEGHDVSTEDLRVALKKYRSFFDRLLAV
jgi:hypothetical protein